MNRVQRQAIALALLNGACLAALLTSASPVAAREIAQQHATATLAMVDPTKDLVPPAAVPTAQTSTGSPLCTKPRRGSERMRAPIYPPLAKALSHEGSTELRFIVETDGSVAREGLRVTRSSGFPLLDEAAVTHMFEQRFVPANCSGVPARMPHAFRVVWKLTDTEEPCLPPADVAGMPQRPAYPSGAEARREEGTVGLAFIIDVDGSVMAQGLTIIQDSGHADLNAAAVLFILKHRFTPAQCDGEPSSSAHFYEVKFELPGPSK